ncbi:MAG: phage tail tape measure protein [Clostridia bacterium]|nr:phage tail tape measure protein [Clostridia bacterium]MCI9086810.1 phage tail tape measure protein [Clostridia bacterium]
MAEVIDELIVRISGDASDLESTINSVSGELSKLDRQQNGNNLSKSAGKVAESWQKAGKSIKDFGEGFDKATKPLQNAAVALSVGGVAAAKFAVDFENNFANVKKTVDGTPEQLEKIRQEIIDMSTVGINGHSAIPQTTAELTELAAAGGQLGIETERIAGFTETMAMLGTATNLSGEEGAATLAKFANVTKMSQENFDRLGSSIVDLGNNFATTESDIANMSMRLAGAGTQVGLNQADILGIATALSSVGIEAEMGGSAFSKAMIAMQMASSTGYTQINEVLGKTGMSLRDLQLMSANNSKDFKALADNLGYTSTELTSMMNSGVQLENFAKITGKTTEEFKNLFDSSPAEAIDAFIKGLQNSDSTGESAIEMLQEMGFTEVRLRDSLLRLANSEAGVTEAVTRSNQAWEENTALQNEFNAKAETTASQLAVTKNNFIEAGRSIGETMLPTIKDVSAGIAGFAQKLASMDDSAKKTLVNTASGVIALGIASKGIAGTIKNVGGVVEGIGTMQKALSAGGTLAKFAPALASIGSVVGPAALGVAGITTAVVAGKAAYDAWYNSQYRWTKGLSEGNAEIQKGMDRIQSLSKIQQDIKAAKLIIENPESSKEQVSEAKAKIEEIKVLLEKEYDLKIKSDNSNLESTVEMLKNISENETRQNILNQTEKLEKLKPKFDEYQSQKANIEADLQSALEAQERYSELRTKVSELDKTSKGYAQSVRDLGVEYGVLAERERYSLNVNDAIARISSSYHYAANSVDKYSTKLKDLEGSYNEYIAISTEIANWQTELIGLSALDGNTEKVQSHLSKLGESIRRVGLDMDGYAQAAAKAMNGIDLETAWNQGGEALDNFANDYVRSMKEFGASAEETYTGAALIRQGFHSIAEAAAKGEIDNVTAQANELAHKIDAIPADKHIVINASGDISIIEDVQSAVDKVNASGDVQLMVSATGDVSVLETADEKLQELINNNQVTVTFNAQTNGFDISNLQGDKIGQITADGKINWTQGEIEKPKDEKADGTIDYKLGEVAKPENAIAEGTINYKIGRVEKPKPNARGTQNFSGGLALVNDDGHADPRELIIDRGRAFIPEGRDVVLPLSKGAKVYTSEQTKAIMSGLGIPRYASGKNNSDAFTTARDNWSHYTKTHSITTEQELQKWLEFQEKYKKNEKDIWDIEEQIFSIQKKLYSERVSESEKWLKHEEKYNGMSISDYLAGIDRMKAYTAEYYAQGIINHKEYTEAIADLDEKYLDKRKEQLSELYDLSTAYVSEHSYFNDWDDIGDDPLTAYNRVMDRHKDALANGELTQKEYDDYASKLGSDMLSQRTEQSMNWLEEQRKYFGMSDAEYVEGLERIKAYTQEYYDKGLISRREYNEAMTDLNHSMWDEALDAYDDMLQKQQDYISEMREQFQKEEQTLQDSWAVADRKTDMSEVQAQLDIYSGAVTDRGQQKYKELQEQMKQLQRDEELYNLQVRNNATIESLEADYKTLEENKKNVLDSLRATDVDISSYVKSLTQNISQSRGNIEGLLSTLISKFDNFKVESNSMSDNRKISYSFSQMTPEQILEVCNFAVGK